MSLVQLKLAGGALRRHLLLAGSDVQATPPHTTAKGSTCLGCNLNQEGKQSSPSPPQGWAPVCPAKGAPSQEELTPPAPTLPHPHLLHLFLVLLKVLNWGNWVDGGTGPNFV